MPFNMADTFVFLHQWKVFSLKKYWTNKGFSIPFATKQKPLLRTHTHLFRSKRKNVTNNCQSDAHTLPSPSPERHCKYAMEQLCHTCFPYGDNDSGGVLLHINYQWTNICWLLGLSSMASALSIQEWKVFSVPFSLFIIF